MSIKLSDRLSVKVGEQMEETPLLCELFHEQTKRTRAMGLVGDAHIARVMTDKQFQASNPSTFKTYPGCPAVALPAPGDGVTPSDLLTAVRGRRSPRAFSPAPATLAELSYMLHAGYGITGSLPSPGGLTQYLRAVPSAGALYPVEIYVAAFRVEDLNSGLYHYNSKRHGLSQLKAGSLDDQFFRSVSLLAHEDTAAFAVLLTAVLPRVTYKYWDRGYRFALLEAGAVAHGIGTAAASLSMGILPFGAYYDDELHRLIGVDGVNEVLVHLLLGGHRVTTAEGAVRCE